MARYSFAGGLRRILGTGSRGTEQTARETGSGEGFADKAERRNRDTFDSSSPERR